DVGRLASFVDEVAARFHDADAPGDFLERGAVLRRQPGKGLELSNDKWFRHDRRCVVETNCEVRLSPGLIFENERSYASAGGREQLYGLPVRAVGVEADMIHPQVRAEQQKVPTMPTVSARAWRRSQPPSARLPPLRSRCESPPRRRSCHR